MADEAEQGGGGGSAGGGSVLKKYGPLAVIVLLAQVVLAWVVINFTVGDKMGSKEQDEPNQKVLGKVKWDDKGKKKIRITDIRVTGLVIQ